MRIVFMGSSDFAMPSLQVLYKMHEIVAVYTSPAKPADRGQKVKNNVVADFALRNNLKLVTPHSFKLEQDIDELKSLNADIVVVVSYGLILPKEVIYAFPCKTINLHPSNLPKLRGAAPIERAIMLGEEETAICVIEMAEKLDSGDIILRKDIALDNTITSIELSELTSREGANMLISTLDLLLSNGVERIKQDDSYATYAKKIKKEELVLDFHENVKDVYNKIRAFATYGYAHFIYNEERIKIISAQMGECHVNTDQIGLVNREDFSIYCAGGIIKPRILQRAGKNPCDVKSFLSGFRF